MVWKITRVQFPTPPPFNNDDSNEVEDKDNNNENDENKVDKNKENKYIENQDEIIIDNFNNNEINRISNRHSNIPDSNKLGGILIFIVFTTIIHNVSNN